MMTWTYCTHINIPTISIHKDNTVKSEKYLLGLHKPRAFNSHQYAERTSANSAFQKCLKYAERRVKLRNQAKQEN